MPRRPKIKLIPPELTSKEIISTKPVFSLDNTTLIVGVDPGIINIGVCFLKCLISADDGKNSIFNISFHKIESSNDENTIFQVAHQFIELLNAKLSVNHIEKLILTFENYPFLARSKQLFQTAEIVGGLITITKFKFPFLNMIVEKVNPLHARVVVGGSKSENNARRVILNLFRQNNIVQNLSNHEIDAFIVANAYLVDTYHIGIVKNNIHKIILQTQK